MRVRFTGYISIFLIVLCIAQGQEDSLLKQLDNAQGKQRIEILHQIIINVWLNYPRQAMGYGEEALELSKTLGDSALISKSLRLIAGVHYYKGDYDKSLEFNQKALKIAQALEDSALINNGFNNIGLLYYNLGSYQTALEYLLRSRGIKERIGEIYGLTTTLNNIGLVFERIKEYETARAYFEEAYDVSIEIVNRDTELYSLNNIGITYLREGKIDEALGYFRRGLKLGEEIENINWGAVSARGIAEVLMTKGENDSVEYYLEKSLKASDSIDDKKGLAEAYYLMAKNSLMNEDYDGALDNLSKCESWANQIQVRQQQLDNLKLYSEIYDKQGNEELENEYLSQYINLRDSLFQDVMSRNLDLIPIKIKEEQDRFLLTEQQIKIRNQVITNQLFTVIIIITMPLLVILIILLRKNHKKNKELQRNNEELKQTQKLLITSEKMASLGVLAAGVGHEINNPLNFIKNGIEALSSKIGDDKDEELKSYFRIVNEGVDRATNIVKSLSHFSRKGPSIDERCNIHEIIENCLLILHNKIRNRIRVATNFTDQGAELKGNEGRLHQAMMNIISNAEQAIDEEGTIEISTRKKNGFMEIEIADDGEGIPEENLLKISDPFFTTKPPGEGTGLGLFITFSIVEEHGGSIDVQSTPNEGTKFIIKLPL
ncbi:tetratricopeptide repeat-containing sensor histidine kinase [Ekhidna sp.]|uniref:tetratricopeptide repeat-containing sensor histidine kinase n=1 Tax=Ekhidna sp. TaxID=2608089 RepID=UPI003CCB767D